MTRTKTLLIVSAAVLLSAAPASAAGTAIKNLVDGREVTVSGTVEELKGRAAFTLRDSSGTVKVDSHAAPSLVLKNGEHVTVTGVVEKGMLGTTLAARKVEQDKTFGEEMQDTIDAVTGEDPYASARLVDVKSLPDKGLVRIEGTVDDLDGARAFTLKDGTGHVDIRLPEGQSASLHKGAAVSVIGYVDTGLLEKTINARKVVVRADGAVAASP